MNHLIKYFRDLEFHVLKSTEIATILLGAGVDFDNFKERGKLQFQENLIKCMMQVEKTLVDAASSVEKKSIIFCDRGIIDASTYMDKSNWNNMMEINGWSDRQILQRYVLVIFLESPQQIYYQTENNPTRKESFEESLQCAAKLKEAWKGHANLQFVSSKEIFDEKQRDVTGI